MRPLHPAVSILAALLTLPAALGAATPAEPLRLYLAEDDHTDYLWTADAETYDRVFVEMLDHHLRLADETAGHEPALRHRFNCDGHFWLWAYERRKTPEEFAALMARVRDGTISVPLNALVSCYGGQPTEAALRGMYYAGRLERRFGVRFRLAVAMENQSLPLGLASLWAGAGAEFSWRGVCGCASRLRNTELARREHEIYWCTGPDRQRVLMKWHSLALPGGSKRCGGYAEAFDPVQALAFLENDPTFLARYRAPGASEPYHVRAAFGFGWDALDRKTGQPDARDPKQYPLVAHFHEIARAATTPTRQVIVSNEEDFFRDFAARYGRHLPAESVSYGNEWDLYSASMAETSARVRRAVERLRAAEAIATVARLRGTDPLAGREAARDEAFMALGAYWEHDWTADGPVPRAVRAAWQEKLAEQIESYVDGLQRDATAALARQIPRSPDAVRFFAFNPLGWARTDAADFPYAGPDDIHVRDLAADADTPHQFVTTGGVRHLRILARDVPSVGYKVFEIRPGPGDAPADAAATFHERTLENSRVKLRVEADGALGSLIHKSDPAIELAATIRGAKINDFAPGYADGREMVLESSGPVSVTVRVASDAEREHVTRVTLYRDSARVDLDNDIEENFGDVRHWAFSFNLAQPHVRTEEIGAVLRVRRASDGGDYAERNARCDYATLNHFADISDGGNAHGVTLSNWDCAFVRLGESTPAQLDTATAQLNVLAGGQVDGARLGIRNQNGATHFRQRFALHPHRGYDPVAAMRFALEHQNPLIAAAAVGASDTASSPVRFSTLTVSDPSVLLWACKPADEGVARGIVVRLWNVADTPVAASRALAGGIATAWSTTHLETDLAPMEVGADGAIRADFARQQMRTFRLMPRSAAGEILTNSAAEPRRSLR